MSGTPLTQEEMENYRAKFSESSLGRYVVDELIANIEEARATIRSQQREIDGMRAVVEAAEALIRYPQHGPILREQFNQKHDELFRAWWDTMAALQALQGQGEERSE